jgi:hypothetical protein
MRRYKFWGKNNKTFGLKSKNNEEYMRDLKDQCCNSSRHIVVGLLFAIVTLSLHQTARAQADYDVTINTTSLAGTGATLTFDFIAGGGTQSNSVTISDFSTNGTLVAGGVNSGSVIGSLPGTATLTNSSFFNELQQGMTLGSTISFQVDLTTNAPTGGSLPDTFSLFLLDPTATYSLVNTNDPTGSDSLTTVQIDGTKGGGLGVYSGSGPSVPVGVIAVTPTQAPELDAPPALSALTLFLGGLVVLLGRSSRELPAKN